MSEWIGERMDGYPKLKGGIVGEHRIILIKRKEHGSHRPLRFKYQFDCLLAM